MYKMLQDCTYSDACKHIHVKKDDVLELPEFVAKSWLSRGICELDKKPKFNPVEEKKVVEPVAETKAPKPKTKKKK